MAGTGRKSLNIESLDECMLWQDDETKEYYVEIQTEWDGIRDIKDLKRLRKFIDHCIVKMEKPKKENS